MRLDLEFPLGFHLLLAERAQGKTNLGRKWSCGAKGYFIGGKVVGPGDHEINIYWSAWEPELALDGHTVKRLADYFWVLRMVAFCSGDLQLIKGPARGRRWFMDLLLAPTDQEHRRLAVVAGRKSPGPVSAQWPVCIFAPQRAAAAAGAGAENAGPGVHDLHGGKLAARTGRGIAAVGGESGRSDFDEMTASNSFIFIHKALEFFPFQ